MRHLTFFCLVFMIMPNCRVNRRDLPTNSIGPARTSSQVRVQKHRGILHLYPLTHCQGIHTVRGNTSLHQHVSASWAPCGANVKITLCLSVVTKSGTNSITIKTNHTDDVLFFLYTSLQVINRINLRRAIFSSFRKLRRSCRQEFFSQSDVG